MKRIYLLFFFVFFTHISNGQTKLNIFSTDGYKFYLIVNGLKINNQASERVENTLQGSEKYFIKIIFSNFELPDIDEVLYNKNNECTIIDYSIITLGEGKGIKTKLVKSSENICKNGLSGIWVAQINGTAEYDTIKINDSKGELSFFQNEFGKKNFGSIQATVKPIFIVKDNDTTEISWYLYFGDYNNTESNLSLGSKWRSSNINDKCNDDCYSSWEIEHNSKGIKRESRGFTIKLDYSKYKAQCNVIEAKIKENYVCKKCTRKYDNGVWWADEENTLDYTVTFMRQ